MEFTSGKPSLFHVIDFSAEIVISYKIAVNLTFCDLYRLYFNRGITLPKLVP